MRANRTWTRSLYCMALGAVVGLLAASSRTNVLARSEGATQKKPADSGKKPNILVIFGDDIGQTNISALDWMPTLLAAAGESDITNKLLKGYDVAGTNYKVHLDGYNQLPYLTGQQEHSAR